MKQKTSFFIGVILLFGIGFLSSSIIAAKKSPFTVAVFAQYPLANDQWFINGKVAGAGRGLCKSKAWGEDWRVQLSRADGTKAELTIATEIGLRYGFPFVGISVKDPLPGYNAGLHAEELTSSTLHQNEFSCQ